MAIAQDGELLEGCHLIAGKKTVNCWKEDSEGRQWISCYLDISGDGIQLKSRGWTFREINSQKSSARRALQANSPQRLIFSGSAANFRVRISELEDFSPPFGFKRIIPQLLKPQRLAAPLPKKKAFFCRNRRAKIALPEACNADFAN